MAGDPLAVIKHVMKPSFVMMGSVVYKLQPRTTTQADLSPVLRIFA